MTLWTADPTDCCGGAHQLGVCYRAEADAEQAQRDADWLALTPAEQAAETAAMATRRFAREAANAAALAAGEVF
jgi:hypothetical protein